MGATGVIGVSVEFFLLGPVEARVDGRTVEVGPARQRCVLAGLLVDANRTVPVSELVDRVWGAGRLPVNPAGALQTYVSLLRRILAGTTEATIVRQRAGYRLTVDPEAVDLHRFVELSARARTAAERGDDESAAGLFERALRLWRGAAFTALDTPWIDIVRAMLHNQRMAAELDFTDVRLRLGDHAELLGELSARTAEWPLDERLAGQLMLALYRSGRQADALEQYQQTRRQLDSELGATPSRPLSELYQQILTADPALAGPEAAEPQLPVPRQLPAPPRLFTGRGRELARLTEAVREHTEHGNPVVISAIGGAGGIGKTWLALHWAHQHVDRFPDGQLYVNLRGFDAGGTPMPATVALRGFLDAFHVDPNQIPLDPQAQAALYRSLVAGKRILIVLDNAADTSQVVPLLPGKGPCAVLITSRRQLAGLVAAHSAELLTLDVLSTAEAGDLFTRHLGAGRVAAEPRAAAELLRWCAGLPLAISIVAARAAIQPDLPLRVLAQELRTAAARLDALDVGEPTANLRAAFSWSYRALEPDAAAVFALLGLAPGPDLGLPAAAGLVGLPVPRARAVLSTLERVSLVQQHLPGRYRMHDLIQLYALEQAQDLAPEIREAALRRLFDGYLHTALTADRLLAPRRPVITVSPPVDGCVPSVISDPAAALAWFDVERACLHAAHRLAVEQARPAIVWQLAWALNTFHNRRGHLQDQVATWQAGVAGAEETGDPTAVIVSNRWLGHAYAQAERPGEAIEPLRRALAIAEETGDRTSQALTHHILAHAWELHGDDHQALHHAGQALRVFRTLDDPIGTAQALNAKGWYHARLGQTDEARACCESALALHREHDYDDGIGGTLDSLGYIAHQAGEPAQAIDYYREALALYRKRGNTYDEAITLDHLAEAHAALNQHTEAREAWQQAMSLYRIQQRSSDAERVQERLDASQAGKL